MIVIHISDVHVGRSEDELIQLKEIFDHIENSFDKSAPEVLRNVENVVVVHTGDLVHNGTKSRLIEEVAFKIESFVKRMKQLLGSKGYKFLYCIGNHDLGSFLSFQNSYEKFEKLLGPITDHSDDFYRKRKYTNNSDKCVIEKEAFQGCVEVGNVFNFIILNSLQAANPLTWAIGDLGHKQIEWLDYKLAECGVKKNLIFLHHHPFTVSSNEKNENEKVEERTRHSMKGLVCENDFKNVLQKHKNNIIGVVYGHRHRREVLKWIDIFREENEGEIMKGDEPILFCGGFSSKELMYEMFTFDETGQLLFQKCERIETDNKNDENI